MRKGLITENRVHRDLSPQEEYARSGHTLGSWTPNRHMEGYIESGPSLVAPGGLAIAGYKNCHVQPEPYTFNKLAHAAESVRKFITALFEDDMIASRMHRRRGPEARLDELRMLMNHCIPFCLYSLTVYFPDSDYHDIYQRLFQEKNLINTSGETNSVMEPYNSLSEARICAVDSLPCYNI